LAKSSKWWEADDRVVAALFLVGLAISLWMISRVQAGYDATDMLSRGWLLIQKGIWVPLGNPATGGGYVPGGMTALLVGLPLGLWMDHRAPILLILITHIVAYLLLDRLIKETLGPGARILFAVFYWINPWRLYQSAWLDNSNYAFIAGAIHLWACYRQRHKPNLWLSFLMVAMVGLSVQLHLSALVLILSALFLWWRGYWKVHWGGAILGAAVTFGGLVPFALLAIQHPELIPINRDPVGLGLVRISPVLKGIIYWFRYGSLFCSSQSMYAFDFSRSVGPWLSSSLTRVFVVLGMGLGSLTIAVPILANFWCWRRRGKSHRVRAVVEDVDTRSWLREYALWSLVACVAANALSPAPAMWWHNLVILQAAVLPVLLWGDALLHTRVAPLVRRGLVAYLVLSLVLLVGMAVGSEQYLYGGDILPNPAPANLEIRRDIPASPFNSEHFPRRTDFFYQTYMRPYEFPAEGS